jgi:hypothetical protein
VTDNSTDKKPSALDRAKAAWGSQSALIQGHKAEVMERNNYLRTGITNKHFRAFRQFCLEGDQHVVAVRQTKSACVKWIEEGCPAKPGSIVSIKCDQVTGFVTCQNRTDNKTGRTITFDEQVNEAWRAGYYVLMHKTPDSSVLAYLSQAPAGTRDHSRLPFAATNGRDVLQYKFLDVQLFVPSTDDAQYGSLLCEYRPGTVVDKQGNPLTGDYDIMFAFPVSSPGGKQTALVGGTHAAGARGDSPYEHDPEKLLYERTNPWIKGIIESLNRRLDGVQNPRIMHSFHDLRYAPTENNDGGCTLFTPDGTYWLPTPESVEIYCRELGRAQGWQMHTR